MIDLHQQIKIFFNRGGEGINLAGRGPFNFGGGSGARRIGCSFTRADAFAMSTALAAVRSTASRAHIIRGGESPGFIHQHSNAHAQ